VPHSIDGRHNGIACGQCARIHINLYDMIIPGTVGRARLRVNEHVEQRCAGWRQLDISMLPHDVANGIAHSMLRIASCRPHESDHERLARHQRCVVYT